MVNEKTVSGKDYAPGEAVSVKDALRIYTYNGAYASFEENIKGSLEPGKLADITVLDRDVLSVPKSEIRKIQVDMTIVDGKIAYRRD